MSTTVTSTATFGMDAFSSLAVVPSSNTARGTITFTSAAPKSDRPSFTAKLQAKEFGPFLVPMSVSIVVEDGSCTYQITGNSGGYYYDSSNNVTGLVGPDGDSITTYPEIDAAIAPYKGMVGPTQLIGSALTGTHPFLYMESFWEAIRRKSCKVCFLGDSVTENIAQNWPAAHWTIEFERELRQAFPDVAFEFVNLSIGGKIALQVLGRAAGSAAPTSALDSTFVAGASETAGQYSRNATSGATAPTNPETWQGSAAGVAQYANGDVWMNRIASHNFDLVTLTFGLNEENTSAVGKWWFAASVRAIIENIRSHTTFNGFTRPSIICGTPYNDTVDRSLRNRLADQMFAVAQQYGCPVIDANRWDGIAVEGVDRQRQRWYGEMGLRYLVNSKNDNTLSADRATYWEITGTPNTGAGGTTTDYLSGGGSALKILRKYESRDVQINGAFNSSSSGTVNDDIMSLWYRVDPSNNAIGYEVRYEGSGTLSLIWHDSTGDVTVYSKSIYALTSNTEATFIAVRVIGAVHEVWTAFGATAPATGYDPKSMRLQFAVRHTGAESAAPLTSDIFKPGWSGLAVGGDVTVPALRVGDYPTTTCSLQFGAPLLVNNMARATMFDMNGTVSDHPNYQPSLSVLANGDSRGGNVINHLATDAYSLVYAAAIGSVITQLAASRRDVTVLQSSAVAATAPLDTAENVLATIPVPAALMGKNSELRISALFSFTGSTNSKTAAVKFGPSFGSATSVGSLTTASAGNVAMNFDLIIKNRNDQKVQSRLVVPVLGTTTISVSQSTVDTTADNNIYIAGTKATGAESLVLERYTVQLVGG